MDRDRLPTAWGELELRRARPEDLDSVIAILEEAAAHAASKGMPMWPLAFPRCYVDRMIAQAEVYLVWLGTEAVGTLTLYWSDPEVWGPRPDDAGYVHKLAVRRAYAGRQLGLRLLEWAAYKVAATGRSYLRVDCMAENPVLTDYYDRAGFTDCGEASGPGWRARLYQKVLEPRVTTSSR